MWLLVAALIGLLVPNGLFVYWFFFEFETWRALLQNTLALAFIIDAFMAVGLLAIYFARRPIGGVRWTWFILLSLVGGLGFSLPLYYWLNLRRPDIS